MQAAADLTACSTSPHGTSKGPGTDCASVPAAPLHEESSYNAQCRFKRRRTGRGSGGATTDASAAVPNPYGSFHPCTPGFSDLGAGDGADGGGSTSVAGIPGDGRLLMSPPMLQPYPHPYNHLSLPPPLPTHDHHHYNHHHQPQQQPQQSSSAPPSAAAPAVAAGLWAGPSAAVTQMPCCGDGGGDGPGSCPTTGIHLGWHAMGQQQQQQQQEQQQRHEPQQQQQQRFPPTAVVSAAFPAGFGLGGCGGGRGSATVALGWAEPVRQLYAFLDSAALQGAAAAAAGGGGDRLIRLRVHWVNRPPALAVCPPEVITAPRDCTVGCLKRLICRATGGTLWPHSLRPLGRCPRATQPHQHPQQQQPGQRPHHHQQQQQQPSGKQLPAQLTLRPALVVAPPAPPAAAATQGAETAAGFGAGPPAQVPCCWAHEVLRVDGVDGGGSDEWREEDLPADGEGGGVGNDCCCCCGGSCGRGGEAPDNLTLAEAGFPQDSDVALEAELQLLPNHVALLQVLLQNQALLAATGGATTVQASAALIGAAAAPAAAAAAAARQVAVRVGAGSGSDGGGDGGPGGGGGGGGGGGALGSGSGGGGSSPALSPKAVYGAPLKERFTLLEMSSLVSGIEEHGLRWAVIHRSRDELRGKTQMDLKDKWRNWRRNVAASWSSSRVELPEPLRRRIGALVAAAQRGELPTAANPAPPPPPSPLSPPQQPQQTAQRPPPQQAGSGATSLQAPSSAIAAVAAVTVAAGPLVASPVIAGPAAAGAGAAAAATASSAARPVAPPGGTIRTAPSELGQGQLAGGAPSGGAQLDRSGQGAGQLSPPTASPAAQLPHPHPHPHPHQHPDVLALAAHQLQLQAAQAARAAQTAQEAHAHAQAQLAAAAAAVAAAAASAAASGQMDGGAANTGFVDAGRWTGPHTGAHGPPGPGPSLVALPLSPNSQPLVDRISRLVLPPPAAAAALAPGPGSPGSGPPALPPAEAALIASAQVGATAAGPAVTSAAVQSPPLVPAQLMHQPHPGLPPHHALPSAETAYESAFLGSLGVRPGPLGAAAANGPPGPGVAGGGGAQDLHVNTHASVFPGVTSTGMDLQHQPQPPERGALPLAPVAALPDSATQPQLAVAVPEVPAVGPAAAGSHLVDLVPPLQPRLWIRP